MAQESQVPPASSPPSLPGAKPDPIALLRGEMRVAYGAVADGIGGQPVSMNEWLLRDGEFLMRLPKLAFHYRKGAGVTVERSAGQRTSEEQLYLNGSVYAAIACIHGFYPIHASAVAWNGAVHAFTGPSGAGKSTLVTGLGNLGLPMFCDDTLILDLSDPGAPLALPGHKRLKLTAEALALTGAAAQERVDDEVEKFFAQPPGGDWHSPLPLARLVFLEVGNEAQIIPMTGAEKLAGLIDDHYTTRMHRDASGLDAAGRFALQARLAGQIDMVRLVRPWGTDRFASAVALARDLVCRQ